MGEQRRTSEVNYETILPMEAGQRLDNYLIRKLKGVPRTYIYRVIRKGEVRVNKKRAKPSLKLSAGDIVRIPPVRTASSAGPVTIKTALKDRILSSIIFEDDGLLVLNKPSGMPVHGGSGLSFGVIEALRAIYPKTQYFELVHRLDRETSGVLLIAKKRSVLRKIQALFQSQEIQKTYWLLAQGAWQGKQTVWVDLPLKKNHLQSGERIVRVDETDGKASKTQFKLIENYTLDDTCWLEAKPKTGRTHQIRVHAASIGHPILGDSKYGQNKSSKGRLLLHASAIQFTLDEKPYNFQVTWDETCNEVKQSFRDHGSNEETR